MYESLLSESESRVLKIARDRSRVLQHWSEVRGVPLPLWKSFVCSFQGAKMQNGATFSFFFCLIRPQFFIDCMITFHRKFLGHMPTEQGASQGAGVALPPNAPLPVTSLHELKKRTEMEHYFTVISYFSEHKQYSSSLWLMRGHGIKRTEFNRNPKWVIFQSEAG